MPTQETINEVNILIMFAKILFLDNSNINDKQIGKRCLHLTRVSSGKLGQQPILKKRVVSWKNKAPQIPPHPVQTSF